MTRVGAVALNTFREAIRDKILYVLLFFAVEFALTGRFPRGPVFHLMLLPGILFLLSACVRRRMAAG